MTNTVYDAIGKNVVFQKHFTIRLHLLTLVNINNEKYPRYIRCYVRFRLGLMVGKGLEVNSVLDVTTELDVTT